MSDERYVWHLRNPSEDQWVPFEWDEPMYSGQYAAGEIVVARESGTSGNLMAGFWRARAGGPGCNPDGSCTVKYSAPLGDENLCVVEGEAIVTNTATGEKHHLTPGTIMIHPKGVELLWETKPPYFKKYWCIFDSPKEASDPPTTLSFGNINDNPAEWAPYSWTELEGDMSLGELYIIKETGTTGTHMAGIWRSGVGTAGCDEKGMGTCHYRGPLGDETILLLEGNVTIKDEETGEVYNIQAGDIAGYSIGHHIHWTSQAPFVKKFWTITQEPLPEG